MLVTGQFCARERLIISKKKTGERRKSEGKKELAKTENYGQANDLQRNSCSSMRRSANKFMKN